MPADTMLLDAFAEKDLPKRVDTDQRQRHRRVDTGRRWASWHVHAPAQTTEHQTVTQFLNRPRGAKQPPAPRADRLIELTDPALANS